MTPRADKNYPHNVFRLAVSYLITHFRVFLQFAAIPIFVAFLAYFSKFLVPQGNIVVVVLKVLLAFVFGAYFSVRWIRYIFLQEHPVSGVAPLNFSKRDLLYAFMNVVVILLSDTFATLIGTGFFTLMSFLPVGGFGSQILTFILKGMIAFFMAVRLKFVFIDIALDRQIDFKKAWKGTEGIWLPMFGYLFLALFIFGMVQMLCIVLLNYVTGEPLTPENATDIAFIVGLMQRHSWVTDSFTYFLRAIDFSIVIPFYLYKFKE